MLPKLAFLTLCLVQLANSSKLGGGLFVMKAGSSASATTSLTLYQGADTSGPVLATVTLSNSQFCGQTSNCGSFAFHQYFFTTPITLLSGSTYFAALTSSAPNPQSQAYFIKSDNFFASDVNGAPLNPPPLDPPVPEPEPSTFLLTTIGLVALAAVGIAKNRRL
jgi:hypothetical protein